MKKLYFLLITLFITSLSFGQVIASDGFSYPDGSLIGNGGWANHSGTAGTLLVSSGQVVVKEDGTAPEDANLAFSTISGNIYYAFDFSVDDLGVAYPAGTDFEYFAHFKNSGSDYSARLDIVPPSGSGDYSVGIASDQSTADAVWATDLSYGTTYRVIVRYDQDTNIAELWIGATSESDTSILGADQPDPGDAVSGFALRQSNSDGDETILVDNLMIGGTFNDVLVFVPSTNPTLLLSDGPTNGDIVVGDPETINNANIDFTTTNFTMCVDATGTTPSGCDGYIKWTVYNDNGDVFVSGGSVFTSNDTNNTYPVNGLLVGETYSFRAELVDNNGDPLGTPVVYSFTMTIATYNDVPDLATLRASTVDPDIYYRVTGEVLNTYSRTSNNQKYFQDATGGILVHDPDFVISTVYVEGDGVTNMRGHLEVYNGLYEFVPTDNDNWGKSSTANVITPEVVSIADVAASLGTYESKLVRINNVTFADGDGVNTFSSSTNYVIDDGTASTFRTSFYEADYVSANDIIPTGPINMSVIVGNFNGSEQFTARSLSELTLRVERNAIDGFILYPNPVTNGKLTINTFSNTEKEILIYNILGKRVLSTKLKGRELNVKKLTSGIYVIKILEEGKTATRKLVIK